MARLRATHAPAAPPKTGTLPFILPLLLPHCQYPRLTRSLVLKPTSTAIAKKPAYSTRQTQKREINVVIFLRKKLIHERFVHVPLPQFNHILELRAKHRNEFLEKYELTPPPSENESDDSYTHWETFKTFSSAPVTPTAAPEPEIERENETQIKQEAIEFPLRATTADTITQPQRFECMTVVYTMMPARLQAAY